MMGGVALIWGMVGARGSGMLVQWSSSMFVNLVTRIPILYWWWCLIQREIII